MSQKKIYESLNNPTGKYIEIRHLQEILDGLESDLHLVISLTGNIAICAENGEQKGFIDILNNEIELY